MNTHIAKPVAQKDPQEKMEQLLPTTRAATQPALTPPYSTPGAVPPNGSAPSQLPGLDTAMGIHYANNKPELFLKLLKMFRDGRGGNFQRDFSAVCIANDWAEQHRLAHSLKGLASTLGAIELSASALELQVATQERDSAKRDSVLPGVLSRLQIVLDGLRDIEQTLGYQQ